MKRLCLLLLIISLLFTCFISCNQEQTMDTTQTTEAESMEAEAKVVYLTSGLKAHRYGSSESAGSAIGESNDTYKTYDFQDDSVSKTVKMVANGTEYELQYEKTTEGPLYRDTVHKYSADAIDQWFNAETGKCVYYYNPNYPQDAKTITKEAQMEVAQGFLKEQVVNPEQFEITKEKELSSGVLIVWFSRMNNGYETCEKVSIWVHETGFICLYQLEHINEMSDVEPIPDEVIQRVNKVLKNEQGFAKGEEMTYEAEIDRLVRLDDGSLAFDCHIEAKGKDKDGNVFTEGAWFIIPITEPTIQVE